MLLGNGFSGEESIPDGMQRYNFDSRFTMLVPDDARFLKEWNESTEIFVNEQVSFLDKHNKFAVAYIDSPLFTSEFIDFFIDLGNSSGNASIEFDGDLIISHNLKNSGKVGKNYEKSEFEYTIISQNGHEMVSVHEMIRIQ